MTIEKLNQLDCAEFIAAIGWVFEHSPWVSERACGKRPFATPQKLHEAMVSEVEHAAHEHQLALLRAHPDLGTRAKLSDASTSEQTGAGLSELNPAEFERFQSLNHRYTQKFGFPFLFAVKGSTKHQILYALEIRLPSAHEEEFAEALRQVYRIAEFRLRDYLEQES